MRKFTIVWNIRFFANLKITKSALYKKHNIYQIIGCKFFGKEGSLQFSSFFFSCFIMAAKPSIAYPWSFAAFCWRILYIFSGKQLGYFISTMSYTTLAFKELNIQLNKLKSKGTKNRGRGWVIRGFFRTQLNIYTTWNTVISSNFLAWKYWGKVEFPQIFGRIARKSAKTVPFHKMSTPGNYEKVRYFT